MNITKQQLAYAAKALGVELLYNENRNAGTKIIQVGDKYEAHPFGPGFAEWAVPLLESRLDLDLLIEAVYKSGGARWRVQDIGRFEAFGPDIDTAVLLLAAKIGDGME